MSELTQLHLSTKPALYFTTLTFCPYIFLYTALEGHRVLETLARTSKHLSEEKYSLVKTDSSWTWVTTIQLMKNNNINNKKNSRTRSVILKIDTLIEIKTIKISTFTDSSIVINFLPISITKCKKGSIDKNLKYQSSPERITEKIYKPIYRPKIISSTFSNINIKRLLLFI